MSFYDRMYKVPVWVLVSGLTKPKTKAVLAWLKEAEALERPWLGDNFLDTIKHLATQGYASSMKEPPYVLNIDFFAIAAAAHLRKIGGPDTYVPSPNKPMHLMNRNIDTKADYDVLLDEFIFNLDPLTLSHIYKIKEKLDVQQNLGKRHKVWVSSTPSNLAKHVLTKLSDKFITIGSSGCDINLEEVKKEEIAEKLAEVFAEFSK